MITIRVEGPYYGSYSLSAVNFNLAVSLSKISEVKVFVSATSAEDWKRDSQTEAILSKYNISYHDVRDDSFVPDIIIRNSWPITSDFLYENSFKIRWFAWEENTIPFDIINNFNSNYDCVAAKSIFVKDALINSGIQINTTIIKDAPVLPVKYMNPTISSKIVNYLHISSCFPRKSPDVLIHSFLKAFKSINDVKLTIKTFHNIHNEVPNIINNLSEHDKNKIEVIYEDLKPNEIVKLIENSHYHVFPSRGEGYGLPVDESHVVGRPNIIPKSSALKELFIGNIDYEIEHTVSYANTHVSVPNSLWYEPCPKSLSNAFIQSYKDYKSDIYSKKVSSLKDLKFNNWESSASSVIELFRSNNTKLKIISDSNNLVILSSINQVCGIATYIESLIGHLDQSLLKFNEITVLAPLIDNLESEETVLIAGYNVKIIRCWRPWTDVYADLEKIINKLTFSHFMLQYHTGFFDPVYLDKILNLVNRMNIFNISTFHNFYQEDLKSDHGLLIDVVKNNPQSKFIVHSLDEFKKCIFFDNVILLPHGYSISKAYAELRPNNSGNLANSYIVCSFGFLRKHKGIRELISCWPLVLKTVPEAKLLLLCSEFPSEDSKQEVMYCNELINHYSLENSVLLDTSFHDFDTIEGVLSYSDAVVFPYKEVNEGASGAIRVAISSHSAVICSKSRLFDEFENHLHFTDLDQHSLAESVVKLITNREYRESLRSKSKYLEKNLNWKIISQRYWSFFLDIGR